MLQLKTYQEKVLDSLQRYFQACDRLEDADSAFYETTKTIWERGIPYRSIKEPSELADIPYICLRLPTGGGKTLLACHAIAIGNRDFLKVDHSIVLWLVPSNAIRTQTIKALRDRNHPYRQALESTLNNVEVMDIEEALRVQQGVVFSSTVVIVATLQAFRVEDMEGRKVYESAGALHHHFQNLPAEVLDILDKDENGVINYSLANVMRIHRPLVIVDEAHNARTDLSFDTLARFRPSAIVEFTATPDEKERFLTTMVGDLVDNRNLALSQLVRKRFILRKIAEEKLKACRQQTRAKMYQEALFDGGVDVVVTVERVFSFGAEYPARFVCSASDTFAKHYHPKVGDLDDKGEEYLCAQFIDQMGEVEFWVRNLDRQPSLSFWLQTSTDKFYPDFVCKLKDGRYLVVEYKGADRYSNDDSKEKRRLGELWELKSHGTCLFVMPKGKDWWAIKTKVNHSPGSD